MAEEIVIDEYTLLNHIATGSSTQVWEAIEKGGGDRHYALKLMLPEALAESEQKAVLKHEAKIAERFDHPNLIRTRKLVMTKKRAYIVMDYFRAPNLKMQLGADGVSLQIRVVRLFEQLCQALGYMHDQGWVHRDVKPDNILFNKASELRLIDFSLSTKAAGAMSKLIGGKEKVIQGTRTYISPETILKAPPSPQSDIYSLGITLFEVLTGEPPFRGTSPDDLLKKHLTTAAPPPSMINNNVTPEMDRFVLKMLAKRTKDRYKNTHELLVEFRNIKPYKEDVAERDNRIKKEQEERYKHTLDKSGRLDSRADHLKQRLLRENPDLAREEVEKKKKEAAEEAEKKKALAAKLARQAAKEKAQEKVPATRPAAAAPAAAAPPMPAPRPAPQMPAYPPGYGYPQQMPPGYPVAGYPPGYPQMPGYPQPGGYPPRARVPSSAAGISWRWTHAGRLSPSGLSAAPDADAAATDAASPTAVRSGAAAASRLSARPTRPTARQPCPLEIKCGPARRSPELLREQGVPLPISRPSRNSNSYCNSSSISRAVRRLPPAVRHRPPPLSHPRLREGGPDLPLMDQLPPVK